MYSTNGGFGQVRLSNLLHTHSNQHLFSLFQVGWHKCNDRYRISRFHGGETHLLLFTLRGNGFLRMKGKRYNLTAGTIAFVPRNIPCSYGTVSGGLWEFYWIHPNGDLATTFLDGISRSEQYLALGCVDYPYERRLESLLSLCAQTEPNTDLLISQQVSELLHHVSMQLTDLSGNSSFSQRAIQYIEQHYAQKTTVQEIADSLFVSVPHLIRVFKKEMGYTPHEFLTEYRLNVVTHYLEFGDQSVETIAEQTGFSSSIHFISSFRKLYGCTPVQYREMTKV